MKIGIIVGSVRQGRAGSAVGTWVAEAATQHGGAEFQLIELADFHLPVLDAPVPPAAAGGTYEDAAVTAWSEAIAGCDGYVFVTPEYNHSVPGGFKNAVDSLGNEWLGKAVGFVGYGADGAVRAVEHWRQIMVNFQVEDVRAQVSLGLFTDFGAEGFAPMERRAGELTLLLEQLLAATARHQG